MSEENKMIQVSETDLKQLLAEIETLKQKVDAPRSRKEPKRVTDRIAHLREWDGALIVAHKGTTTVLNKIGERVLEIELVDSKGKAHRANYLQFLNEGIPVRVKITDQKADKKEVPVATGFRRDAEKGDAVTREQTEFFVTYVDYISDVEVIDGAFAGEKLKIENKFLNL